MKKENENVASNASQINASQINENENVASNASLEKLAILEAENKALKAKMEGKKAEKRESPYGIAIGLLCERPDLSYKSLEEIVNKAVGYEKPSAIRTAFSQFGKIYKSLKANGLIKA
jgi:hypothetical protein